MRAMSFIMSFTLRGIPVVVQAPVYPELSRPSGQVQEKTRIIILPE